jgi:levanase/fructan beta-fructosidase
VEGNYSEAFFLEITQSDDIPSNEDQHPIIHFAPTTGWMNDPNGLIYHNNKYHLYFQYNPFDTKWENMCWGHAVSTDMLHWVQEETVLYPDQDGPIFSGCGIVNERENLGLPKDAYLYLYTCAGGNSNWSKGKLCSQRVAYSIDGGNTLHRLEKGIVDHISDVNRDPKVYWHEKTKAYNMALYLTKNEYAILRSADLETWNITQILTLDQAWECPDFREIPVDGGQSKWMFWSADGFYFLGDFDGYRFQTDGVRREAYKTKLPYAAQTFWGLNDRIVAIPWVRSLNKSKHYTGTMGIPRELKLIKYNQDLVLAQTLIREFEEQKTLQLKTTISDESIQYQQATKAVVEIKMDFESITKVDWSIFESHIQYDAGCRILSVDGIYTDLGIDIKEISIIIDGEIVEVTANHGTVYAVYELEKDNQHGEIEITIVGKGTLEIFRLV